MNSEFDPEKNLHEFLEYLFKEFDKSEEYAKRWKEKEKKSRINGYKETLHVLLELACEQKIESLKENIENVDNEDLLFETMRETVKLLKPDKRDNLDEVIALICTKLNLNC